MGILNVTPDSFADGGHFFDPEKAIAHAQTMETEGADIIDIGAESTREVLGVKKATAITAEEEWRRLEPVLKTLKTILTRPISVDTYRATTAEKAIQHGATIINDIWGLQRDPDMASVVAEGNASVVIAHNQQENTYANDVVNTVTEFLKKSLDIANKAGIAKEKIILDPGIALGKTAEHNLTILKRLHEIKALGFPVLVGFSRKSMIGKILDLPVTDRLEGTLALTALSVMQGADIIRVHDVQPNHRVAKLVDYYKAYA